MSRYPFNAHQTVNILGEIGPLVSMFIVNGIYGIAAGTWALILTTVVSLCVSLVVLGRPAHSTGTGIGRKEVSDEFPFFIGEVRLAAPPGECLYPFPFPHSIGA